MAHELHPMGVEHEHHAGHVTVCSARDCTYNEASRCVADAGIMVNFHQDHADCNTYTRNEHIPGVTPGAAQF